MAKVAFSKLGLKTNNEIKTIIYNEQEIEIKQYLPIEDKLNFIEKVLNQSAVDMYFYNQGKIEIFFTLEIVFAYTNISFTDKQKQDLLGLYNKLVSTGLYNEIIKEIPENEIGFLKSICQNQIESVYHFRDSALGIMEAMKTDYSDMDLDIDKLKEKLINDENISALKEITDRLG